MLCWEHLSATFGQLQSVLDEECHVGRNMYSVLN